MKQQIGLRVKHLRKAKGLTQADMAEAIDKTFETISNIERGKTSPNFNTLQAIAEALEVPLQTLFDFDQEEISSQRAELVEELRGLVNSMDDKKLRQFVEMGNVLVKE